MYGKIVKAVSGFFYVRTDDFYVFECKAKGSFKHNDVTPIVGDDVEFEVTDMKYGKGNITDVHTRFSELVRPTVANVDQAMVVFAVKSPNPNLSLLDRFLAQMKKQNIETIIVFNKTDLGKMDDKKNLKKIYKNSGCKVFFTAAATANPKLFWLKRQLRNKITVMAGPSGVGKSTILNRLGGKGGEEIATVGVISEKIGRGKHTTRHTEIYKVTKNIEIVDTPGFTSLLVSEDDYTKENLQDAFPEFAEYKGQCKFKNCSHIKEKECAVEKAVADGKIPVSRYNSYKAIYGEIKSQAKY